MLLSSCSLAKLCRSCPEAAHLRLCAEAFRSCSPAKVCRSCWAAARLPRYAEAAGQPLTCQGVQKLLGSCSPPRCAPPATYQIQRGVCFGRRHHPTPPPVLTVLPAVATFAAWRSGTLFPGVDGPAAKCIPCRLPMTPQVTAGRCTHHQRDTAPFANPKGATHVRAQYR